MKLFSTSSLLIPITLKMITTPVNPKTMFLLFKATPLKKFVILEFCSFFKDILFVGAKLRRVGRRVKVIINEVIKPKVIIQPKSIIGLIPLKIKDKNANTVVKTV